MKNRRLVVVSIVLIAVLCIGIGYARLSDDLSIGGNLNVNKEAADNAFKEAVHFKNETITADKTSVTGNENDIEGYATVDATDNDKLVISIPAGILNFENDTLTIQATIVNESDEFDADVTVVNTTTQDTAGLTDITCKFGNNQSTTIAAGDEAVVTITITLKETATKDDAEYAVPGEFTFAINATYGNE